MAITVNIIGSLVGPIHMLQEEDVSNWSDIIDLITVAPCDFEIEYNNAVYTGTIAKTMDELTLLVAFNIEEIVLPGGMCMFVICQGGDEPDDGCYPNELINIDADQRLMAVDEDGCPIGYITIQQILDLVDQNLNIPGTLCELLGGPIPEGNLVAQDRIVTTTDGCDLKSVPQGDFC